MIKGLKSLFVKPDEDEIESAESFPKNTSSPASSGSGEALKFPGNEISNKYVDQVMTMYENGLSSINMPGYDFFEFYSAVKNVSNADTSVYKMAFKMASAMDSTITAQKLIETADFYITKLNDVHDTFEQQGNTKLKQIQINSQEENNRLSKEISGGMDKITEMKKQIADLEKKILENQNNLRQLANKYEPERNDINLRLDANEKVKKLVSKRIETVKNEITKFLIS